MKEKKTNLANRNWHANRNVCGKQGETNEKGSIKERVIWLKPGGQERWDTALGSYSGSVLLYLHGQSTEVSRVNKGVTLNAEPKGIARGKRLGQLSKHENMDEAENCIYMW